MMDMGLTTSRHGRWTTRYDNFTAWVEAFGPEVVLGLLLAPWDVTDRRGELAARLIREHAVRWEKFVAFLMQHQIYPTVERNVQRLGLPAPAEVRRDLAAMCLLNAARVRRLEDVLAEVLDRLASRGIQAMPFKGPALARRLFGASEMRHSDDLDVLVHPEAWDEAVRLFRKEGWTVSDQSRYAIALSRSHRGGTPVAVDLHCRLSPDYLAIDDRRLVRDYLDDHSRLLEWILLCIHAGRHRVLSLKWLVDIEAFLSTMSEDETHPETVIEKGLAKAEEYGARRFIEAVLKACSLVLDFRHAPAELKGQLAWLWAIPSLTAPRDAWKPYLGKFFLIQSRWRMVGQLCRYPFLAPPDRAPVAGLAGRMAYRWRREGRRYAAFRQRAKAFSGAGGER